MRTLWLSLLSVNEDKYAFFFQCLIFLFVAGIASLFIENVYWILFLGLLAFLMVKVFFQQIILFVHRWSLKHLVLSLSEKERSALFWLINNNKLSYTREEIELSKNDLLSFLDLQIYRFIKLTDNFFNQKNSDIDNRILTVNTYYWKMLVKDFPLLKKYHN